MAKISSVNGTVALTVASVVYMITGYGLNVWLGRHLGPVFYGSYGVIITLMTLINLAQTSGLPQALSKFVAERPAYSDALLRKVIRLQIGLAFLLGFLLVLIATPASAFFGDNNLRRYIIAAALILPFYGLYSVFLGYFNGHHEFKKQARINITYSIAKLIFVVALTFMFGLIGAIMGFVLAPLAAIIFNGFIPRRSDKAFPTGKLVRFSIPLITFAFLSIMQLSVDLFVIKRHFNLGPEAGFYLAAQNIALVPFLGLSAFAQMILPRVSRAYGAKKFEQAAQLLREALRYLVLMILPLTALIAAGSKQIIELLYSRQYTAGATSLLLLVIAYGCLAMYTVCANSLNGAGKPKYANFTSLGCIVLMTTLCFILIPRYGLNGAAISVLISSLLTMISGLLFSRNVIGSTVPSLSTLRALVLSVAAFFVMRLFLHLGILGLIIGALVSSVLYILGLFILKEVRPSEVALLKRLILKRAKNA